MTDELLQKFWELSSDYKIEVYKIINEAAYYLKLPHMKFLTNQI